MVDPERGRHSKAPAVLAPEVSDLSVEVVNTMGIEAKGKSTQENEPVPSTVDLALRGAPSALEAAVPVDQIMVAVDGVRRYVMSHLSRIGRACDVDDVMQDIRVAVWDGLTRGHYRQLPGIPFGAWVQGVCANVCASHVRRELSHQALPLLAEPSENNGPAAIDAQAVLGIVENGDQSADRIIDQQWARTIIELTKTNVPREVWRLALDSLTGPRRYGPPSSQDRRRWHAVTVVRQTARTVQNALDVDRSTVHDVDDVSRRAPGCLPTAVLRRIAETIVRPGLRGPERNRAIEVLAIELGVSERYIAVQIGFARRLYQAAWRILQAALQAAR
ncbi:sigma factor [Arthrobacter celericrescens]|uniref:sigma factor n=1 Tax=Arthrobacter celericrescens TaxID=2320851 RepID=UPI0013C5348B|nr:sigma factor [Arthrobacter celericrescens]